MPDFKPPLLTCACGCGATFTPPASALNKRFASRECRMGFHAREMREARQLAAELRVSRQGPRPERAADTWTNRPQREAKPRGVDPADELK